MGFLRYHWFDLITGVVVISGLLYGRKRGLTLELVPLLHWITLIIVCGTFYAYFGAPIARWIEIQPNEAFVFVYLFLAVVVTYAFWTIKRTIAKGLPGSKCFGEAEFALGAIACAARFLCIQFACVSLVSAQYVAEEDLAEPSYFHLPEEGRLPSPAAVQRGIFRRSKSGRWLKYHFGQWLIAAQPPVKYDAPIVEGYNKHMQHAIEGK